MNRFHAGEVAMQMRTGDAHRLAPLAPHILRPQLPLQHRDFFAQLPFVVLGAADRHGRLWATLRAGAPGFAQSPDPGRLSLHAPPLNGDPLAADLAPGTPIGVLGLQAHTRRRNRANGRVLRSTAEQLDIDIEQSFGNCPKYIHAREAHHAPLAGTPGGTVNADVLDTLDDRAAALITGADTFFVASLGAGGADVSHRGGRPGFVHLADMRTLLVPDFAGNRFYMTLGNLLADGRAGLAFVDRGARGLLLLSGRAEVVEGRAATVLAGAERGWRFHLQAARRLQGVLPLTWVDGDAAPEVAATGTWAEVHGTAAAAAP